MKSLQQAEVTDGDLNNGQVWHAWIDHDGASRSIEVRLTITARRPEDAVLTVQHDVAA